MKELLSHNNCDGVEVYSANNYPRGQRVINIKNMPLPLRSPIRS